MSRDYSDIKAKESRFDGRECRPEEYRKLCEFREDGSFYMADYVGAETGVLTEIHFDRVYNR